MDRELKTIELLTGPRDGVERSPKAVRDAIHDEVMLSLSAAEMAMEAAISWGSLHPDVTPSTVDGMREARSVLYRMREEADTPREAVRG